MKRIFTFILVIILSVCAGTSFAQTYTGFLKYDGEGGVCPDTLLVTITVPVSAEPSDISNKYDREYSKRPYYATPWMAGIKTNLLSDLISIPYAGVELQLSRKISLDLSGWFSKWNAFYPNKQTSLYGGAPELRFWFGDEIMKRGHFIGLSGMAAWYTMEWEDKGEVVIYQNGTADILDSGSMTPAWSCGLTYGYSLPLDRTGRLGMEFYIGYGYSHYDQKRIALLSDGTTVFTHEQNDHLGITKVGVNLAYRFSLRRVKGR